MVNINSHDTKLSHAEYERELDRIQHNLYDAYCSCIRRTKQCSSCRAALAFKRLRAERDRYAAFTIKDFIEATGPTVDATIRDVIDSREDAS